MTYGTIIAGLTVHKSQLDFTSYQLDNTSSYLQRIYHVLTNKALGGAFSKRGQGGNVLLLPYFEVKISYERLPSLSRSNSSNILRGMSSKSATSKGCDRCVAGSPGQGAQTRDPKPGSQ